MHFFKNTVLKTLCLVFLLSSGVSLYAADEVTDPDICDINTVLGQRDSISSAAWVGNRILVDFKECAYGNLDQQAWEQEVRELLLIDDNASTSTRLSQLTQAINVLNNALIQEPSHLPFKQSYLNDLKDWELVLSNLGSPGEVTYLKPLNAYTFNDSALQRGNLNYFEVIRGNCDPDQWLQDKSLCLEAVNNTIDSLRYFKALRAMNSFAGDRDFRDVQLGLAELEARWTNYFDLARPQNPLELFVNSRFAPVNKNGGFDPVPNKQWILLHPSLGLEYFDSSSNESQFREALIVEVLGINRWTWQDGGMMSRPVGLSIIGSYSDRSNAKDFGWGLMAHYNNSYSLGITKKGDERAIFVSLDLQQFFLEWNDKKKEKFAGFAKLKNLRSR